MSKCGILTTVLPLRQQMLVQFKADTVDVTQTRKLMRCDNLEKLYKSK
jgi:hypothetical protein